VAVLLYLKRDLFNGITAWHDWIGPVLFVIGVQMILHGLYDTCLKKDLNGTALLVALVSFGYLAFLTSRLRGADDEEARRAMLREYKRAGRRCRDLTPGSRPRAARPVAPTCRSRCRSAGRAVGNRVGHAARLTKSPACRTAPQADAHRHAH
jgi:hypothetical protein